jgi:hypothetical protein
VTRSLLLAAAVLGGGAAQGQTPPPTPPPIVDLGPSAPVPASPPPEHGSVAAEVRLGFLLLQEASTLHSTAPAPSLRGAWWLGRHLELDGGYQFAYDEQGTNGVHATNTLHAFDIRLHFVYPLGTAQLTAGAGAAAYVETVRLATYGSSEPARTTAGWGIPVAVGVETWVRRFPVRFEAQVATRGERVDILFASTVGFGTRG